MDAAVISAPEDVDAKLNALGLSAKILRDAAKAGEIARSGCTANDPVIMAGILAWGKTIRALREFLIPLGWHRANDRGLPVVVNGVGSLALAVATGDEGTGDPDGAPRTKHRKGPATVAVVDRNNRQLKLPFDFGDIDASEEDIDGGAITWHLLLSRTSDDVRCELALPEAFDDTGRVVTWRERIVLPPIGLDPEPPVVTPSSEPDIDIPIARRA